MPCDLPVGKVRVGVGEPDGDQLLAFFDFFAALVDGDTVFAGKDLLLAPFPFPPFPFPPFPFPPFPLTVGVMLIAGVLVFDDFALFGVLVNTGAFVFGFRVSFGAFVFGAFDFRFVDGRIVDEGILGDGATLANGEGAKVAVGIDVPVGRFAVGPELTGAFDTDGDALCFDFLPFLLFGDFGESLGALVESFGNRPDRLLLPAANRL
jgi:hypothetical protein